MPATTEVVRARIPITDPRSLRDLGPHGRPLGDGDRRQPRDLRAVLSDGKERSRRRQRVEPLVFTFVHPPGCAFLYHLSTGKIELLQAADHTAVALSAVSLTCARTTEASGPSRRGALRGPRAFQPLLVAGAHMMSTEVAFLRRRPPTPSSGDPLQHTCSGLWGLRRLRGRLVPASLYLHAAWHAPGARHQPDGLPGAVPGRLTGGGKE